MTIALIELVDYLDECLQPGQFQDYCPNGLQVEGTGRISRIATGVTANQALLDQAIAWGADAILVHHGYFWKGEAPEVVGMKRRRLAALLANDINLLAYHLPLDAHPELGNNACFGRLLGVTTIEPLASGAGEGLVCIGSLPRPLSVDDIRASLSRETGREPLYIGAGVEKPVQRIAWCTGAAQGYIDAAIAAGADLYVTGEVSEQTVHTAREEGIHFLAAGHHATERYGVQALGAHLADKFDLKHRFIDIDNPV
ncbi:MAG: Nif3-like dinuclear metal center hexameric protein [Proteobacteria bacterium]|nr:Nif3-like dinuclear metal center hexameric protein [Pseudomonadota bacterium]